MPITIQFGGPNPGKLLTGVLLCSLAILLAMVPGLHATPIVGIFKGPDGVGVTGTLRISFPSGTGQVRNTCDALIAGMPSGVGTLVGGVTVRVNNGTLLDALNLYPTECLTPWRLYQATLTNSVGTVLMQNLWYVSGLASTGVVGGMYFFSDSKYFYQFTAYSSGLWGVVGFPLLPAQPPGLIRGQVDVSVSSGFASWTITWPKPFTTSLYDVACGVTATILSGVPWQINSITIGQFNVQGTMTTTATAKTGTVYCLAHARE